MERVLLALLALLLIPNCWAGWSEWQQEDRALFVASQIAITADWATTRYASKNWDTLSCCSRESNPVLGYYPSTDRVDLYFVFLLVSNYFITDLLTDQYYVRSLYLGLRTYQHGKAAMSNQINFGWRMQF